MRATLLICGFILAVIVTYAAAAYQAMKGSATLAAQSRLAVIPGELASNLRASAHRMKAEVAALAADPAVVGSLRDPSAPNRSALDALRSASSLEPAGGADRTLLGTELRDLSGRRILSTGAPLPRSAWRLDADIARLLRGGEPALVTPLRASGDSVLYATLGRVSAGGMTIGYVVRWRRLVTSPQSLKLISDLIGSDARVYFGNTRGDLWTDLSRRVPDRPIGPDRLSGVVTYWSPEGGKVLAAGVLVAESPWAVLVEFPLSQVLAGPRDVIGGMALFGLLLLLVGAWVAWVLGGRLTRSIVQLAGAAEAIRAGDYSRHTTIRGEDEIGTLAQAFDLMADSVAAARRSLEQKVEQLAASEAENRATRERLEHVITSSHAILYRCRVADGRAMLDWISGNVKRELGYEVEEVLKPGWWGRVLHPADRGDEVALDRLPSRGSVTREYRLRHADGQHRWVRDEPRVLRDDRDQVSEIVGVLSDITEHRRLEVAKEAAEAANRAKNEFLSRMSHELRTPLNAILGFGQILKLDVQVEENRESVEQILKAGEHLLSLINEVLDIARIEAGQMSLSVEPVSVRSVLQESVDLVRLTAAKQGIHLRSQDALSEEHFVRADQQRLKQVLLNLLSNAIKYNRPEGTVTLSCELAGEDHLRISVRDTGYGIPAEKLGRLFTPFDRLGADRSAVEGTGLGLALTKGLVEAMGGRLGVESVEREGSCFWVELSLAPCPSRPGAVPASGVETESPGEAGAAATRTVLFVEDNLANVRLMERILQRRPQVTLLTAMQGRLGLELAREHRPDLILLDLNLPDLSGDEVLLQLRRDPVLWTIPVVMISGDAIPSQVQRMLDLGASDYITKPFDIQKILRAVDESLG